MTGRQTFQEVSNLVLKLNAKRAARYLMEAFPRSIQVSALGEGSPFCLHIRDGQAEVQDIIPNNPDLVVDIRDGARFVEVLRGHLDISHVFASGSLVIERGRASEMILFNRIIAVALKESKQ